MKYNPFLGVVLIPLERAVDFIIKLKWWLRTENALDGTENDAA